MDNTSVRSTEDAGLAEWTSWNFCTSWRREIAIAQLLYSWDLKDERGIGESEITYLTSKGANLERKKLKK